MFKNRTFNALVGLTIAVLAVLSISTSAFTQRTLSASEVSGSSPLDWYFSHDHAILDGDNNVVPVAANVAPSEGIRNNQLAPLDWYFSHDHAILDGDNNVVPNVSIPVTGFDIPGNERYSALKDKQLEGLDTVAPAVLAPATATNFEHYVTLKDKQIERLDAVASAVGAPVTPTSSESYAMLKDKQIDRLDAVAPAVPVSVAPTSTERYMKLKDQQLERLDSAGFANRD
jgi:hypothetical protein